VFVSPIGLGIEDVAAAYRVYTAAKERGLGTPLTLWQTPLWV
jgi:ornithine cyclodeaminase/alanine dehydrogenase-like protein (mu-crystallin family)